MNHFLKRQKFSRFLQRNKSPETSADETHVEQLMEQRLQPNDQQIQKLHVNQETVLHKGAIVEQGLNSLAREAQLIFLQIK